MQKSLALSRIALVASFFLVVFFAWGQWHGPIGPIAASVALLLPDDLPANSHFVQLWQDSAQEEGIHLEPIKISDWAKTFTPGGAPWEGIIVPDTFHRRMDDSMTALLHTYVAGGGRLMLVYDGGLLTPAGFYSPGKSRFSDLTGVDYALYDTLGDKLAGRSRYAMADVNFMEQLHLPPGRYASKTLTFPDRRQDTAGKREDFLTLIFDYNKQPQSFATVTTRGQPMHRLMYGEDGGTLASRQRFGKGETLFVNFPLTYLKQRTDGIFLHSFLHYFAVDMLGQPRLASTPDGKGSIVLNWHVDAKPALIPLKQLKEAGLFNEGPFSFHFTAGPDVNLPGDGGGLDVPNEPQIRNLILGLVAQGHAIGDHGGWIHNYFGNNINDSNQALFKKYLPLNQQALTQLIGTAPREYSAPVGNQPPWVTRWLENNNFVGYYQTGNVGMGPTHAWLNKERMSKMWAFPVLTMGPVATAEEAFFQQIPAADYENWLQEVACFVERDQVMRLVYFHPPGAVLYLDAVSHFVSAIKTCRQAGNCQWITISQAADFLTRREQVQWQLDTQPGGLQLVASDAKDLAHMAWWVPKQRFAKPVLVQGQAAIDEFGSNWRITAAPGKVLKVSLKNL